MEQSRDQIQLSYGTISEWNSVNPILKEGECACVFDDSAAKTPIEFRFGNGLLTFNQLPRFVIFSTAALEVLDGKITALQERVRTLEEQQNK